jgi:hypothetical protein
MASMFYTNATGSFTMSNNMGGLRFNTSGVIDAMNISSSGFVGIGTTDPTNLLTIKNNTAATNGIDFQSYASSSVQGRITFNQADDTFNIVNTSAYAAGGIVFKTNSTEKVRISTAGEMLVLGTYNPLALANRGNITLNGTNSNILVFANNSSIRGYIFHNTTDMEIFNKANGSITFFTNDVDRMKINSVGAIKLNSADYGNVYSFSFKGANGGIDCFGALGVATNGQNIINFFNQGNTYVASISVAASSVTYGTGSDYRLKEDLKDFNGLEKVSAIKVYDFKFKEEGDRMEGVLAHELQEIVPYAVTGYKDEVDSQGNAKIQNVDYSKIVPILVKAIQELKAEIEELKNK